MLGVSVGAETVRAVLVRGEKVQWAGSSSYTDLTELTETIARLAGECRPVPRRARVVLERDLVQTRTLVPAPPLRAPSVARYVALETPRLFRNGAVALVADGCLITLARRERVLWAAAAPEAVTRAIVEACVQAGLTLEGLGPAADVLRCSLLPRSTDDSLAFPNGKATELLEVRRDRTWRSRLVPGLREPRADWALPLALLGNDASRFAAAYAAAVAKPRLLLLPAEARAARDARAMRRVRRLAAWTAAVWITAAGIYAGRIVAAAQAVEREIAELAPAAESALALRRDVGTALAVRRTIASAQRDRSRNLGTIADLTSSLGDSTVLVSIRVGPDRSVQLSGYAPAAARVLARLERSPSVRGARLDEPAGRQLLGDPGRGAREWDRFGIRARLESPR